MTSLPNIKDLLGLCKLKVVSLILLTAVVGMLLAVPYLPNIFLIIVASAGRSASSNACMTLALALAFPLGAMVKGKQ